MNSTLSLFIIGILCFIYNGKAENNIPAKEISDTIIIIRTSNSDDKNHVEKPPYPQRNHLLFHFTGIGATLPGWGMSTGVGLCRGLLGIHFDTDYYEEWTWTVFPAETLYIATVLAGPAFRLKWFRIHVLTGISLLNYTVRGELDSVVQHPCESSFGCIGSREYYYKPVEATTISWPVAVKWYFARKVFGVGMKIQADINTIHSFFSAGISAYFLVPRD